MKALIFVWNHIIFPFIEGFFLRNFWDRKKFPKR